MGSDPPVRAPSPVIGGDTEVSSQRVSFAQGDEGGAGDGATGGNTSSAADHGETISMETEDGGPEQSEGLPNIDPEPSTAPELGSQPPVMGEGATGPTAPVVNRRRRPLWRKHCEVLSS